MYRSHLCPPIGLTRPANCHRHCACSDYYVVRIKVVEQLAVAAAGSGAALSAAAVDKAKAELAYSWTLSQSRWVP